MKITKRQLRRIIREEKQRLLKESALDDAGGVDIPVDELIQRIEKIVMLVGKTDNHLNDAASALRDDKMLLTYVDLSFEANGDVQYHLMQLLGDLKGF